MGGGVIAGIVVPLVLLPILIAVVCLFVKSKKKRYHQGGRDTAYAVYCEYHARVLVHCQRSSFQTNIISSAWSDLKLRSVAFTLKLSDCCCCW